MEKVKQIFEKLQKIVNGIIGLMLIAIMVIIFVQTFTRYVVFYSIPWSEEASRYLFVGMILLGVNIGISQDLMVRIDLIDKKGIRDWKTDDCLSNFFNLFLQYLRNDKNRRLPDEPCAQAAYEYHVRNTVYRIFTGCHSRYF